MLSAKLSEEKAKYTEEVEQLTKQLSEKTKSCDQYKQEAVDQKGENALAKRKYEMSLRVKTVLHFFFDKSIFIF